MTSHLLIEALELVFYIKLPYKGSVTMPSSSNTKYERTEVMYGTENTTNTILGAVVSIKDTGSGIDPDIMPRLFEKFASKSFQGTGLGLFISKKIIEANGGKIWGQNNVYNDDKGATFYFTLPIVSNQIKQREPKQNI